MKYKVLKRWSWNGRGRDDGKRDPNPFAIEEEKQLVVKNWSAQAAAEMVHNGSRLVATCSIRVIVRRIQDRAIPNLVQVSVKLVGPGFGDIIDLGCSIPSLVHRVRERVDGHFGYLVETQNEVSREAAIEICQRIVRFEPVHDIAI